MVGIRTLCSIKDGSDWEEEFSQPAIIGALIVGRVDSSRFPAKILKTLGGITVLEWVVTRLRSIPALHGKIGLATTTRTIDDELVLLAKVLGIPAFRSQHVGNVAMRLCDACDFFGWDTFIRINGDSPLLDPSLLKRGIEIHKSSQTDFVTNLLPRTYPYGVSCEIIRTATLKRYIKYFNIQELEHVTSWFYSHPEQLVIKNLSSPFPYNPSVRLTIDTREDLYRMEEAVGQINYGNPQIDFDKIYEFFQKEPQFNQSLKR